MGILGSILKKQRTSQSVGINSRKLSKHIGNMRKNSMVQKVFFLGYNKCKAKRGYPKVLFWDKEVKDHLTKKEGLHSQRRMKEE